MGWGSGQMEKLSACRRRRRRRRHVENDQIWGNVHFFTNGHVPKIQKCSFLEKTSPDAQRRTELPRKKRHMPPLNLHVFTKILKSHCFSKKLDFDGNYKVGIKQMMKPKMVPMVHTNILYSVDWGICYSKSQFGTKSQNWRFRQNSNFRVDPKCVYFNFGCEFGSSGSSRWLRLVKSVSTRIPSACCLPIL